MNKKEPVAARVAQHQQNSNSGTDGVASERREGGGREDGRACERASERARADRNRERKKRSQKGEGMSSRAFYNSKRPPTQISVAFFFPFLFFLWRSSKGRFSQIFTKNCKKIWLDLQILAKVLAFAFRLKSANFGFKKILNLKFYFFLFF